MRRTRPKLRDFDILSLIGRGGFGEVYLCRRQDTNQTLVIKKVRKQTLIERGMVESIRNERQVLKDTRSEWLVRLLYSFQDRDHLYLGMEVRRRLASGLCSSDVDAVGRRSTCRAAISSRCSRTSSSAKPRRGSTAPK